MISSCCSPAPNARRPLSHHSAAAAAAPAAAPAPAPTPAAAAAATTVSELRGTTVPFNTLQQAVSRNMIAAKAVSAAAGRAKALGWWGE